MTARTSTRPMVTLIEGSSGGSALWLGLENFAGGPGACASFFRGMQDRYRLDLSQRGKHAGPLAPKGPVVLPVSAPIAVLARAK